MGYGSRVYFTPSIHDQYGKYNHPNNLFNEQPSSVSYFQILTCHMFHCSLLHPNIISGLRPPWKNMSREAAVQKIQTEHGNQQGADAEEWSRKLAQVRELLGPSFFLVMYDIF